MGTDGRCRGGPLSPGKEGHRRSSCRWDMEGGVAVDAEAPPRLQGARRERTPRAMMAMAPVFVFESESRAEG